MNYKQSATKLRQFNEWFATLSKPKNKSFAEFEYEISFAEYCAFVRYIDKQKRTDEMFLESLKYNPVTGIAHFKYTITK